MKSDHFEGKSVLEHLKAARAKGALAAAEIHGSEMPGYLSAAADAARDTAVVLLLLSILLPHAVTLFFLVAGGLFLWKIGRSALLGWARLERLHRVIEEERWEIEHARQQEREELAALYQAKGLTGKLLDEVITVMMADDNRLLHIMLEEEMGLALEVYEHPLKQSFGAGVGVIIATALFAGGYFIFSPMVGTALTITIAALTVAKLERNRRIEALIWNLSLVAFVAGVIYFVKEL
ncbi:MAG TPA: VIT1/CCC1 transporter family protein [Rhabdochlamydiaceae bacterium]|nr:VIT1/CCC1 transporter family protein [Rhabdochlamydiaceae bacterium]